EHHPEPEGVPGAVALDDGDRVRRIRLLHQDAEVEPGRPAADADDPHQAASVSSAAARRIVRVASTTWLTTSSTWAGVRRLPLPRGEPPTFSEPPQPCRSSGW